MTARSTWTGGMIWRLPLLLAAGVHLDPGWSDLSNVVEVRIQRARDTDGKAARRGE